MSTARLYEKSARLYDLMYEGKDYSAAASGLAERIERMLPGARDLLDVGCGTGRHVEALRENYRVEGLDLSSQLLERARERCPGIEFHLGDMTDFSLDRSYDVVTCLFSSIGYVRTAENLRRAIAGMARHLRRPGLLIVEPWFTPETFWSDHLVMNVHAEPELKLAWMYRHDREGLTSILDIHFLVGEAHAVDHFVERHELGLFTRDEMESALSSEGLAVRREEDDVFDRGLYLGYRGPE
jgi:SAM-dependent methyltransferase